MTQNLGITILEWQCTMPYLDSSTFWYTIPYYGECEGGGEGEGGGKRKRERKKMESIIMLRYHAFKD